MENMPIDQTNMQHAPPRNIADKLYFHCNNGHKLFTLEYDQFNSLSKKQQNFCNECGEAPTPLMHEFKIKNTTWDNIISYLSVILFSYLAYRFFTSSGHWWQITLGILIVVVALPNGLSAVSRGTAFGFDFRTKFKVTQTFKDPINLEKTDVIAVVVKGKSSIAKMPDQITKGDIFTVLKKDGSIGTMEFKDSEFDKNYKEGVVEVLKYLQRCWMLMY